MTNIQPTAAISPIKKPIRLHRSNNKDKKKSLLLQEAEGQPELADENKPVQHIDEVV